MAEKDRLNGNSNENHSEKETPSVEGEETKKETPEQLDELTALRRLLEEEQTKAAEYLDGWQRERAELANARKRWERESAQTYANALTDSISRTLPVLDDFERAIQTLPDDLNGLTWINGILLIYRKLQTILEQQGVTPIEATPGTPFNPTCHEAITHEPHDTYKAGAIINEFQKGYRLDERIVRPALVRVSAGPPPKEPEENSEATEQQQQ